MSLGHISYHFSSMDALLAEAYALASDQLRAAGNQRLAAKASAAERLEAFLLAGFTPEFLSPPYLRMRIDLWSAALGHPAIAETERALYQRYRVELDGHLIAFARPEKLDAVPKVSDMVMATLDGIWLDWMRRRDQISTQNALMACLEYAHMVLS